MSKLSRCFVRGFGGTLNPLILLLVIDSHFVAWNLVMCWRLMYPILSQYLPVSFWWSSPEMWLSIKLTLWWRWNTCYRTFQNLASTPQFCISHLMLLLATPGVTEISSPGVSASLCSIRSVELCRNGLASGWNQAATLSNVPIVIAVGWKIRRWVSHTSSQFCGLQESNYFIKGKSLVPLGWNSCCLCSFSVDCSVYSLNIVFYCCVISVLWLAQHHFVNCTKFSVILGCQNHHLPFTRLLDLIIMYYTIHFHILSRCQLTPLKWNGPHQEINMLLTRTYSGSKKCPNVCMFYTKQPKTQ